jgi:hypothetical protein
MRSVQGVILGEIVKVSIVVEEGGGELENNYG